MITWKSSLWNAFVLSTIVQMLWTVNGVDQQSGLQNNISIGKKIVQPSYDNSFGLLLASDREMEDIWVKASRVARSELEALRLLRNSQDMMSMSLSSSNDIPRPPVPEPTQNLIPIPMPVIEVSPTNMPPSESPPPSVLEPGPTPLPVKCLEGKSRKEYIFDVLKTISQPETLLDPTTPQGMAYDYLANDDPALVDPCSSSTIEQRFGLTTFYFATQGEGWNDNSGWLGDDQECKWFGVDCDSSSDNSLLITRLLLPNNNLMGSITNEIQIFDQLQRLNVFSNAITGTMPNGLFSLKKLVLLDLEVNRITGVGFPDNLFNLNSLVSYRISNNYLSGSIPSEISTLRELCQLWAAGNRLTGTIPEEIATTPKIESLLLYENRLTGALPETLGKLENLYDLQIYNNTFQYGIPRSLFAATQLETLRLDYNFFSGVLPTEIGNLVNLIDFRVDRNSLYGEMPSEIGKLTKLKNFIVNNNFLTGTFPDVFQNYDSLDFFDVSNCNFDGIIPESVFQIPSIRIAYLSNNTFFGTIPSAISDATLLRDLFLDGNDLTGTVPDISEGQFQDLTEFVLQFNFLTGSVPESICDLRDEGKLRVLFSDCGGADPEIECKFPTCCNRCFEGGNGVATGRRRLTTGYNSESRVLLTSRYGR